MELLQLKYFCHAAATQSFTKTAEAHNVPPSNISHCIKRLEDELNVSLFDSTANRVILNRQGHIFYEGILEALTLIEDTAAILQNSADSNTVHIAVQLNMNIVMRAILRFRQQYPNIEVVTTRFHGEIPEGDFDLLVTNTVQDSSIYETEHVLHDRFFLVTKKGLLPSGSTVDPVEMQSLSYITMAKSSLIHRDTLNICGQLGFTPRIILHSESSSYIPVCIEQGIGAALLPLLNWNQFLNRELVDIKEIGDFYRDTWLHVKKRRYPSEHVMALRRFLSEQFASRMGGDKLLADNAPQG